MAADLVGPAEARLLALERRTARAEDAVRASRRLLAAIQQELWDEPIRVRAAVVAAPPPTMTVIGQVCGTALGCNSAGVATTVYLLDGTNAVISSVTSSGTGAYCLPFFVAGSYKVKADAPASPAGYLANTAALSSYTSGTTTGRNVSLLVDTANYRCTLCCPYPIKLVLNLSSPVGNLAATWDAANSWWEASHTYSGSTISCVGGVMSAPAAGSYTVKFRLTCISPGNVWRFSFSSPGVYYAGGGAASCDPSRFVFYDAASATGCGGGGVGQQSGMFADQPCGAGAFDHLWAIPASETLICQNTFPATTTVAIPFAGNYEWTF